MSNRTEQVLEHYLRGLLNEAPVVQSRPDAVKGTARLDSISPSPPSPSSSVPLLSKAPTHLTRARVWLAREAQLAFQDVQALEEKKRQQLQRLLSGVVVTQPLAEPKVERVAPHTTFASDRADMSVGSERVSHAAPSESAVALGLMEWCENGRPVCAQKRFEALLFNVAGLTLAIPLVALGSIHPITDKLPRIFGQADWFMGLQPTPQGQLRAVNTALFVMGDRYQLHHTETAKYVISIDGMDWGLAVDDVRQAYALDPDAVVWHSQRSKRPWLAGTVKSVMCGLIDIPRMGAILQSTDRNRKR